MKLYEIPQSIRYPGLKEKIKPYKITSDEDMPPPYRQGTGRELHGDWLLFRKTPRIDTAYRPPFPFQMLQGNATLVERPLPLDYPIVPGCVSEIRPWYDGEKHVDKKWVWMVDPIQPAGKWAELMVYLPDGTWEPCYLTRSFGLLGNKIPFYVGLKHDPHPVDSCAWSDELSGSIKWNSLA